MHRGGEIIGIFGFRFRREQVFLNQVIGQHRVVGILHTFAQGFHLPRFIFYEIEAFRRHLR